MRRPISSGRSGSASGASAVQVTGIGLADGGPDERVKQSRALVVAALEQRLGERRPAERGARERVQDVGRDLAHDRPARGGDPPQVVAEVAVVAHQRQEAGHVVRAPAPHGVELRRGVEARLVRLHDPDQPVAVQVAVVLEPVVVASDPRLLRRVADGQAPRPRQQRRLDARGHRRVVVGDVVEEPARAPQRRVPEDRVTDEAVGVGGGEQRLELACGSARGQSAAARSPRSTSPSTTATGSGRGSARCSRNAPRRRGRPRASCPPAPPGRARGSRRCRSQQWSAPVATGRSGSRLHCDHEPGNNRPGPSPARSSASRL